MMRVISSPSSSTMGCFTSILGMVWSLGGLEAVAGASDAIAGRYPVS
jgi:hypothetical protein